MLEVVLGLEFVICVCAWSFLGQLLRGSQSANFYQYGTPSVTTYLTAGETMLGLSFGILMAFLIPAVVSWAYANSSRKFKREPIFPKSQFYIGLFMIFSVVKAPFIFFSFFAKSFFVWSHEPFSLPPFTWADVLSGGMLYLCVS